MRGPELNWEDHNSVSRDLKSPAHQRLRRGVDYAENLLRSNDISSQEVAKPAGNPTPEMYNDNFGGEHDSQEGRIPDDVMKSQHLVFDADAYNRALGIEARNTARKDSVAATAAAESGVVRRIQHYQTVFAPQMPNQDMMKNPIPYEKVEAPRYLWSGLLPPSSFGLRSFNGYAPSYNNVWSAYTSIVEYAPQGDHCLKDVTRKKREASPRAQKKKRVEYVEQQAAEEQQQPQQQEVRDPGYQEFFVEDLSRTAATGPRIFKLKVRKGGVAIAGPGGIATAGSGGTAIVGPGGTAYTTQDGTAVVGPGGRVIEIPSNFHTTKIEARTSQNPDEVYIPPGGRILANGPFVYYGKHHNGAMAFNPIVERL